MYYLLETRELPHWQHTHHTQLAGLSTAASQRSFYFSLPLPRLCKTPKNSWKSRPFSHWQDSQPFPQRLLGHCLSSQLVNTNFSVGILVSQPTTAKQSTVRQSSAGLALKRVRIEIHYPLHQKNESEFCDKKTWNPETGRGTRRRQSCTKWYCKFQNISYFFHQNETKT